MKINVRMEEKRTTKVDEKQSASYHELCHSISSLQFSKRNWYVTCVRQHTVHLVNIVYSVRLSIPKLEITTLIWKVNSLQWKLQAIVLCGYNFRPFYHQVLWIRWHGNSIVVGHQSTITLAMNRLIHTVALCCSHFFFCFLHLINCLLSLAIHVCKPDKQLSNHHTRNIQR